MSLEDFERKVKADIPLARHLDFSLLAYDGKSLSLGAPFSVNRNDKQTVFAGSQASLALLAGWSLATLRFASQGVNSVAAVKTDMHFQQPIQGDFIARANFDSEEDILLCEKSLERKGRGRILVTVALYEQDDKAPKARVTASYYLQK